MSEPTTLLYFAYGSNMLTRRLQERVPSARAVSVAALPGHELHWHKVSRDGSGKCDIVEAETPLAKVFGVVFEIDRSEKPALDKAEGLGGDYSEKQVLLESGSRQLLAWTYYATKIDPSAVPYTWYKALVVSGAREHSLHEAYICHLEAVAAKVDSDAKRAERHFLVANAPVIRNHDA